MDNMFKEGYFYLIDDKLSGKESTIIQVINPNHNDPFMLVYYPHVGYTTILNYRIVSRYIAQELGCNKAIIDTLYGYKK